MGLLGIFGKKNKDGITQRDLEEAQRKNAAASRFGAGETVQPRRATAQPTQADIDAMYQSGAAGARADMGLAPAPSRADEDAMIASATRGVQADAAAMRPQAAARFQSALQAPPVQPTPQFQQVDPREEALRNIGSGNRFGGFGGGFGTRTRGY